VWVRLPEKKVGGLGPCALPTTFGFIYHPQHAKQVKINF